MPRKKTGKIHKNFEQFNKKMHEIEDVVPQVFVKVAKRAAIKFVNEAKDITDKEKLVDTGAYKRNWTGDIGITNADKKSYKVIGYNPMKYASHLEYGHKLRNGKRWKGRFVGTQAIEKAKEFAYEELKKELGSLFESP